MTRLIVSLAASAITSMILITACVTPADIDFPEAEQQLVVYSHIGPGDPFGIHITHTRDPLKPNLSFHAIENAQIRIYVNDELEYEGHGRRKTIEESIYFETDVMVSDGNNYSIEVEVEDYPEASAETTVPHDRADISEFYPIDDASETGEVYRMVFSHKTIYDNYYRLILKRNISQEGEEIDTEIIDYELNRAEDFLYYDTKNNKEWSAVYPEYAGFLFAATEEANDEKELFIYIPDDEINTNDNITYNYEVELHNLSASYYRYHESVQQQLTHQNHLADPSLIYNNFKGGFGNFSAYNVAIAKAQRISGRN